jgi:hypothetical protein
MVLTLSKLFEKCQFGASFGRHLTTQDASYAREQDFIVRRHEFMHRNIRTRHDIIDINQ